MAIDASPAGQRSACARRSRGVKPSYRDQPVVRCVRGNIKTVTGIITALVIGLVIGALARLVLPGKQDIPIWLTILIGAIGAIGAILGTLLAQNLGVAVTPGIDWIEIVLQVAIAAVGVAIVSGFYNRRHVNR